VQSARGGLERGVGRCEWSCALNQKSSVITHRKPVPHSLTKGERDRSRQPASRCAFPASQDRSVEISFLAVDEGGPKP
jgi:hypothetical protein